MIGFKRLESGECWVLIQASYPALSALSDKVTEEAGIEECGERLFDLGILQAFEISWKSESTI
jgi:hypothetical protein